MAELPVYLTNEKGFGAQKIDLTSANSKLQLVPGLQCVKDQEVINNADSF